MANAPTATRDPATLHPDFRVRMERVFARLRAQGHDPAFASAWRDTATQAGLLAKGYTKVAFSFHNAVDAAGRPAALAADVIDRRYGWSKPAEAARFWHALGQAAKMEGLHWGGDWSRSNPRWAAYGLGWDPAHVQLYPNSALGQVKALYERARVAPVATGLSLAQTGTKVSMGFWILGTVIGTTILWAAYRRRRRFGILRK